MDIKKIPVTEFQCLMEGVSLHGNRHLLEAEADITQTSLLLNEAIEKLSASFLYIYSTINEQQQMLEKVVTEAHIPSEQLDKFMVYRDKIGDEINMVVTEMQFQDLTSQLLARTIKRLHGLRGVLSSLAGGDTQSDQTSAEVSHQEDVNHDAVRANLHLASTNLSHRSSELQAGMIKQVNQQHLGCGEIELF